MSLALRRKNHLSKYSRTDAEISFPRSLEVTNAREYLFFLEGDYFQLQKVCDSWFNIPSQGALQVRPLGNRVIAKLTDCHCLAGPDCTHDEREITNCDPKECRTGLYRNTFQDPIGYMMYNALDFLFFGIDQHANCYLISPFRYSDNGIVMVNERQQFGFPTSYAEFGRYFKMVSDSHSFKEVKITEYFSKPSKKGFQCSSMMHFEFPEENVIQNEFAAGGISAKPVTMVQFKWEGEAASTIQEIDPIQLEEVLTDLIFSAGLSGHDLTYLYTLARRLMHDRQYLSLIQYRDIVNTRKAMIQSILEIKAENVEILRSGMIESTFEIDFDSWKTNVNKDGEPIDANLETEVNEKVKNNFKIAESLGVKSKSIAKCCYMDVSFTNVVSKIHWNSQRQNRPS